MTFPVPSAKLFTTESSVVGGRVDNNANAVVNLHIIPPKKAPPKPNIIKNAAKKAAVKYIVKKANPVQVLDERKPKVFSSPPQYPEESQFTPKVESNPVQIEVQEEYIAPKESTPIQEESAPVQEESKPVQDVYEVVEEETPVVYASTYEELAEEEEAKEQVDTESKHECFYRTVLEAYVNNPTLVKHYILFKTSVLQEFIRVLTEADSVEINFSEDVACWAKVQKINKIDSIVVIKDNVRSDFRISYNEWYTMFKDFRVSLEYTLDG